MLTRAPQIAGAGAALTALIALAHAQDLCDSMQIGNETQFALSLAERRVEPHMFTLEISEPDVCSASEAAGLRVTACDREQAPRVYLLDTARGVVVRESSVATPAYVYITVYCASDSEEALDASVKSPVVSNRFLEEALLQSSIPSPPLPLPPTVRFVSSPTILSAQPRSISTPDSLPPSEVEPPSVLTSATDEYLPPVQLESRFSSLDQSIPTILSSRLKDLWNGRAASSLGQLKSQSYPKSISSRSQENEPSLLDKAKNQPSILDSYSSLLNGLPKWPQNPSSSLPDTSSSSLAKRLTDLRPKQPSKWLANRSPAWLKRPTRRPSSPWLKLRSLPDGKTRKSMAWSRNRPSSRTSDYGDSWSPYDVDQLFLHWSDEPTDPNTWYTDGEPHSQYYVNSGGPSRSKHPQAHHFLEGPPSSLSHESPSSSAITHMSKKQIRYVPPIHEEDPALLAKWKRDLHRLPRPLLPKLLLLLQEQDHPALLQRKSASAHSIEDDEPLWLNQPFKENLDEGFPWQADYPADYSADDGDSHSYLPEHYTDDREQSPHFAVYIEEPEHPRCPQCGPEHHEDARHPTRATHFPWHPGAESPQVLPHPPLVSFDSQSYLPERHTDDREQSPHFAPVYIEEPEHPRCPQCGPGHAGDARHPTRAPLFPWHPGAESPQVLPHPPLVFFYSQSYLPERYTDDREQSPHFAPVYIEEPEHSRCPQCGLKHPGDTRHPTRAPHFPWHPGAESPQVLPHPPLEYFDYYSPTSPTERPLPTSTVRHSLSWVKSSNPLTPMQLQHRSLKAEPSEHHPSAAPWSFLSQLLLSHPTFRDSTHVIRIR